MPLNNSFKKSHFPVAGGLMNMHRVASTEASFSFSGYLAKKKPHKTRVRAGAQESAYTVNIT